MLACMYVCVCVFVGKLQDKLEAVGCRKLLIKVKKILCTYFKVNLSFKYFVSSGLRFIEQSNKL